VLTAVAAGAVSSGRAVVDTHAAAPAAQYGAAQPPPPADYGTEVIQNDLLATGDGLSPVHV
jgi:hypothetical protein